MANSLNSSNSQPCPLWESTLAPITGPGASPTVTSGLTANFSWNLILLPDRPILGLSVLCLPSGATGWSWAHGLLPLLRSSTFSNVSSSAGHFHPAPSRQDPLPSSLPIPALSTLPHSPARFPQDMLNSTGQGLGPRGNGSLSPSPLWQWCADCSVPSG